MEEDIMQMIKSQKNNNLPENKRKEKMEEFVEKIKSIKLDSIINIECLINTLVNGVTFSSIHTFFFLIFFIIFFFVKL